MANEGTKAQIKAFFDKAIEDAKNPDKKVKKELRLKRKDKIAQKFGL